MFPSHIKRYEIPVHTEDWFKFRSIGLQGVYEGGIGASEAGIVMGLQKKYHPSKPELFHHKVGTRPVQRIDNEYMFHGREREDDIARYWQCWSNTDNLYYERYGEYKKAYQEAFDKSIEKDGNYHNALAAAKKEGLNYISREMIEIPGYLVNEKYPWLFVSLDRAMAPGSANIITGEEITKPSPLEIKTIKSVMSNQWESGIPPKYLAQVHQQMIVTETDYSEIAMLEDGNRLVVIPVEYNEKFGKQLIEQTEEFWYNVQQARSLVHEFYEHKGKNNVRAEQILSEIDSMEPEVDGSENTEQFIKDSYKQQFDEGPAPEGYYKYLFGYHLAGGLIDKMEEYRQKCKNKLLHHMKKSSIGKMDFGPVGCVTLKNNSSGSLVFRAKTNPKYRPSNDRINQEIKKIDVSIIGKKGKK